ncbi:MAG: hypothetical protein J6D00_05900 [Christensenellaceae bacterium]|nr:hypothetical protein [Christensenellaceae bacterium]
MHSILEELYFGNISPIDILNKKTQNEKLKDYYTRCQNFEEKLNKSLVCEFDELTSLIWEICSDENAQMFSSVFALVQRSCS